jgi:hypothetical protein
VAELVECEGVSSKLRLQAAAQANSKSRWLRAPATSSIWTMRSPVSGDLLLSLAAINISQVALQRDFQLVAIGLKNNYGGRSRRRGQARSPSGTERTGVA